MRLYLLGSVLYFEVNSFNISLICFQVNSQATYKLNLIKTQTFLENFMDVIQENMNPMPWTIHQQ